MKIRKVVASCLLALCALGIGVSTNELFVSDIRADSSNQLLVEQFTQEHSETSSNPEPLSTSGKPSDAPRKPDNAESKRESTIAVLSAEKLGKLPVVDGVLDDYTANQLLIDMGLVVRYQSTADIGSNAGNTALIGHRLTHGSVFKHVPDMEVGERLTLTTATGEHTYEVIKPAFRIQPEENWILTNPLKGESIEGRSLLTLITCGNWLTSHREVVVLEKLS